MIDNGDTDSDNIFLTGDLRDATTERLCAATDCTFVGDLGPNLLAEELALGLVRKALIGDCFNEEALWFMTDVLLTAF